MAYRVAEDERQLIVSLLRAGFSIRQVGRQTGRSTATVQLVAREARLDVAALARERVERQLQLAVDRAAAAGVRVVPE